MNGCRTIAGAAALGVGVPSETKTRRRKPRAESSDIGAMLARVCKALVRRASDGDLLALEELVRLQRTIGLYVAEAARGAHDGEAAYSWTEVGYALETSRQNARQRFAR